MSKILLVEDDSATRLLLTRELHLAGYEVTVARNGEEGLRQAMELRPALIICDWVMPLMDGVEVCRHVKASPELATTFFILLTSREAIADRVEGLDAGADDFLSKPVDLNELLARVRAGLRLYRYQQDLSEANQQLSITLQDLQRTQSQLVQSEKMSSLGQMVAGVAHEINNPIGIIEGNLSHANTYLSELLELMHLYQKHYPNPAKEIEEYAETIDLEFLLTDFPKILESMEIGASRIGNIVLSLRNFSRLDEAEMKLVDLHEGLDSTLVMLQHRVQESGVEVIKEFGNLPQVECYPRQLNQVFLNILNNAIDALEQKDMGTQGRFESRGIGTQNHPLEPSLRESPFAQQTLADSRSLLYGASAANDSEGLKLRTRPLQMSLQPQDSPCITIHTELVKAQCQQTTDNGQQAIDKVVIRIADNGPGMTESVRQRLFDPFFTTKQVGKGTGLGLSISYQIVVQRHGGQLYCISEPGQGTEFFIEIPVLQPPESSR